MEAGVEDAVRWWWPEVEDDLGVVDLPLSMLVSRAWTLAILEVSCSSRDAIAGESSVDAGGWS